MPCGARLSAEREHSGAQRASVTGLRPRTGSAACAGGLWSVGRRTLATAQAGAVSAHTVCGRWCFAAATHGHTEWQAGRSGIAAGGGAGRRSAKNADAPMHQSREAHHPARPYHSPLGGPCAMAARYLGRLDLGALGRPPPLTELSCHAAVRAAVASGRARFGRRGTISVRAAISARPGLAVVAVNRDVVY